MGTIHPTSVRTILSYYLSWKIFWFYVLNTLSIAAFLVMIYLFESIPVRFSWLMIYIAITWILRYVLLRVFLGAKFAKYFSPKENFVKWQLVAGMIFIWAIVFNSEYLVGIVSVPLLLVGLHSLFRELSIYRATSLIYLRPLFLDPHSQVNSEELLKEIRRFERLFMVEKWSDHLDFDEVYVEESEIDKGEFFYAKLNDPSSVKKEPKIHSLDIERIVKPINMIDDEVIHRYGPFIEGDSRPKFILYEIVPKKELKSMLFVGDKWLKKTDESIL